MKKTKRKQASNENFQQLKDKYQKLYPVGDMKIVSTGSIVLDYVLGGGFPIGKTMLLSSAPSLGKTLTTVWMAKAVLEEDPEAKALLIDAESGIVDLLKGTILTPELEKRFVHIAPHTYEDTEEVIRDFISKGNLRFLAIDSITSLMPNSVLNEGDNRVGAKAGMEGTFIPKLKALASMAGFGVVYVNQQRANIQMTGRKGAATKSAGGWALKHYTDIEVFMRPRFYIYDNSNNKRGACVRYYCEKNRLVGNRDGYVFLKYGSGILNLPSINQALKYFNYVTQAGSYFKIKAKDLGLDTDPEVSVQGNVGLEEFTKAHFSDILKHLEETKKMEDFLENFQP